jgi:hypothetical protein
VPKLLARLRAAVGPAKRRSQLGAGLRVLELRRGLLQRLQRFLEQGETTLAALDKARGAQGPAERAGGTPGARELEFWSS